MIKVDFRYVLMRLPNLQAFIHIFADKLVTKKKKKATIFKFLGSSLQTLLGHKQLFIKGIVHPKLKFYHHLHLQKPMGSILR